MGTAKEIYGLWAGADPWPQFVGGAFFLCEGLGLLWLFALGVHRTARAVRRWRRRIQKSRQVSAHKRRHLAA